MNLRGLNLTTNSAHTDIKTDAKNNSLNYFSQLKKHQVVQLWNLYKFDFNLFSYPPPLAYIEVAGGNLDDETRILMHNLSLEHIKEEEDGIMEKGPINDPPRETWEFLQRAKIKQTKKIEEFNKKYRF